MILIGRGRPALARLAPIDQTGGVQPLAWRRTERQRRRNARRVARGQRRIAIAVLGALAASAAVASGSSAHDLRGTWVAKGPYSSTETITAMNLATGAFAGRGVATNGTDYTWPDHGRVSGSGVTWTAGPYDQLPAYSASCKGTLGPDGNTIAGSCHDTNGRTLGWTLVRTSTSTATDTTRPVAAAPGRGTVLVRNPHSQGFVPLTGATHLPVGTTVDVVRGWIRLGSGPASAQFYRGEFTIGRRPGGVTTLTLGGGTTCPAGASAGSAAAGSGKKGPPLRQRKLWGTGHGKFTTVGSFASASVVGTRWLTQDTCDGTMIRVAQGEVRVTDLVTHRTFLLSAPHSYLARR